MELRERRTSGDLKQEELALRVGMSRASVANIEGGRQAISLHQFVDLVEALGTTGSVVLQAVEARRGRTAGVATDLPAAVQAFIESNVTLTP